MKVYRVKRWSLELGRQGFSFHETAYGAAAAAAEYKQENAAAGQYVETSVEAIEFPFSKDGILRVLNRYASHNDNG
jgi:hypothetical protein